MERLILCILLLIMLMYLIHRSNIKSRRGCNCAKCGCGCVRDNFELTKTECSRYPLQGLKPDYGGKEIDENEPCTRFVRAP